MTSQAEKCPKNEHKYLAFPSIIVLKVCTVQGKGYTFPILVFQNIMKQILLNVKKVKTL